MQKKTVVVVGLNHQTAPVGVREKLAFDPGRVRPSIERLMTLPSIAEGVILSTCNRVEAVAAVGDQDSAVRALREFLLSQEPLDDRSGLEQCFYTHLGGDAVKHLFRVGASLDSMVVGEPQILGQLKNYYFQAREAGGVGTILHRLFHRAFSVAKRVRTETGIGSGSVSVSSVAVELARRIFDHLENKTVMLIGAGKTGSLLVRHLRRNGVNSIMVTNRTFEGAVALAAEFHGSPIRFEDFVRYLRMADMVVGCTASQEFILGPEAAMEALRERKQRPIFFVDLGVPRNFDPRLDEVDNAYLYNIDDLKGAAAENLRERGSEAKKAEAIVEEEVGQFLRWLGSLEQVPVIVALRRKFEEIRQGELEKSLATSLRGMGEEERRAIEAMTQAMLNKILHAPVTRLKRSSPEEDDELYAETLRKLFDLEKK
jgi:glutamyl-tRNA reductase